MYIHYMYIHVHTTVTTRSADPPSPLLGLPGLLGRPVFHFSLPFFIVPYITATGEPAPAQVHTRLAYRPTFSDSTRLQTAVHRPRTTDYTHSITRYPVSTFTFTLAAVVSFRLVSSRLVSFDHLPDPIFAAAHPLEHGIGSISCSSEEKNTRRCDKSSSTLQERQTKQHRQAATCVIATQPTEGVTPPGVSPTSSPGNPES